MYACASEARLAQNNLLIMINYCGYLRYMNILYSIAYTLHCILLVVSGNALKSCYSQTTTNALLIPNLASENIVSSLFNTVFLQPCASGLCRSTVISDKTSRYLNTNKTNCVLYSVEAIVANVIFMYFLIFYSVV